MNKNVKASTVTAWRETVRFYKKRYEQTNSDEDRILLEQAKKELRQLINDKREATKDRRNGRKPRQYNTRFSKVLKRECLARSELADLSGVGRETIQSIATGKVNITEYRMSTILKILKALGNNIKLQDLMEDEELVTWAKYL